MLTQDDTRPVSVEEKTRELAEVLRYNQVILDRLSGIEERLGMLKGRLSGDSPKIAVGNSDADASGGIMGLLQRTHQATSTQCDAIVEWLDNIECVV